MLDRLDKCKADLDRIDSKYFGKLPSYLELHDPNRSLIVVLIWKFGSIQLLDLVLVLVNSLVVHECWIYIRIVMLIWLSFACPKFQKRMSWSVRLKYHTTRHTVYLENLCNCFWTAHNVVSLLEKKSLTKFAKKKLKFMTLNYAVKTFWKYAKIKYQLLFRSDNCNDFEQDHTS